MSRGSDTMEAAKLPGTPVRRLRSWLAGVVVALVTGAAGVSAASTVTVNTLSFSHGFVVANIASIGDTQAGRFELSSPAPAFFAWCVDIHNVLAMPATYDVSNFVVGTATDSAPSPTLLSASQVDQVAGLALAGDAQLAGPNTWIFAPYTDTEISAAIQIAIWRVIYPLVSITTANANVNTLLTAIFANIGVFETNGAALSPGSVLWLTAANPPGTPEQALITIPPGSGGFFLVPAPAGLLVFGLGLLGLAALRRVR